MIYLNKSGLLIGLALLCCSHLPEPAKCLQQQQLAQPPTAQNDYTRSSGYPYYMGQSPVVELEPQPNQAQNLAEASSSNPMAPQQINQRTLNKPQQKLVQTVRKITNVDPREHVENQIPTSAQPQAAKPPLPPPPPPPPPKATCFYDKRYFAKLDECLAKKPYPTVGLLAFKNEDLLVRGSPNKHGCVFVLNNGLFKNYQISRYSVDSNDQEPGQCLDNTKVTLSMGFTNVTLSYLWTLRCQNRADQLLDDATMSGLTVDPAAAGDQETQQASICVGSSQNFGFASLQLTNLEAQVDLVTDIYKNWRVTNATVSMTNPGQTLPTARSGGAFNEPAAGSHSADMLDQNPLFGTSIKEYVFESLDGDELNWRYLHLFQNWSRNRLHANFVAQYRRFLWISLQRCLAESSEKLPTKLMDIFTNQKFS